MHGIYQCILCSGPVEGTLDTGFACSDCHRAYPVRNNVPIFLKDVSWRSSRFVASESASRAICQALGFEPTPDQVSGLREILAWNYDLPDFGLNAENNYFVDRVRGTLESRGASMEGLPPARPPLEPATGMTVNKHVQVSFVSHYFPETLPPGSTVSRNVRIQNTGSSTLTSRGRGPVSISYHWRDGDGRVIAWDGKRTDLLIDLPPGRALTLPVLVTTPACEGPVILELIVVQGWGGWHTGSAALIPLELRCGVGDDAPSHWRLLNSGNEDYAADHALGRDIVLRELRERGPGKRLLEVGGCCFPQMDGAGWEIYNVDIDIQALQVGALIPRPAQPTHFVAADAANLPFRPASFDAVLMFGALHHFADPIGVLKGLRPLVKDDGFVGIICEPCGHVRVPHVDPVFRRELEQGINEQSFSAAEYAQIFDLAGLDAFEVVVHVSSLKALLRPGRTAPRRNLAPLRPAAGSRWGWLWSWLRHAA